MRLKTSQIYRASVLFLVIFTYISQSFISHSFASDLPMPIMSIYVRKNGSPSKHIINNDLKHNLQALSVCSFSNDDDRKKFDALCDKITERLIQKNVGIASYSYVGGLPEVPYSAIIQKFKSDPARDEYFPEDSLLVSLNSTISELKYEKNKTRKNSLRHLISKQTKELLKQLSS